MTYKLITEDKLKQALDDAQSTINSLVDFDRELTSQGDQHSKEAKACEGALLAAQNLYDTLRAVMEREGPKQSAWLVSYEKYAEAFVRKTDADAFANSSDAQSVLGATDEWTKQPLYTLPDEPTT